MLREGFAREGAELLVRQTMMQQSLQQAIEALRQMLDRVGQSLDDRQQQNGPHHQRADCTGECDVIPPPEQWGPELKKRWADDPEFRKRLMEDSKRKGQTRSGGLRITRNENPQEIKKYEHIKPAPILGPLRCFSKFPGGTSTCTLSAGHSGPHVAHGLFKKVNAVWRVGESTRLSRMAARGKLF